MSCLVWEVFFVFYLRQCFYYERNVWKIRVFMMIAKEAKIWLKCFLQFLHDLICDFFALYLSQYRLNKLFLHNLFLWFSFYVEYLILIPHRLLLLWYIQPFSFQLSFPSKLIPTIQLYLALWFSLWFYSFALLFHATFPSSLLPKFTISTTSFFECYFSYLVKDILCQK